MISFMNLELIELTNYGLSITFGIGGYCLVMLTFFLLVRQFNARQSGN